MIEILKAIREFLQRANRDQLAQISASLLAPGLVFALALSGTLTSGIGIDLGRPIAISQLRTEISENGDTTSKHGIALIVEPLSIEYRIPLVPGAGRIWSSLDIDAARANADRLVITAGGLRGKAPFLGVTGPVTLVVPGEAGKEVYTPGGRQTLDDWQLPSRRSTSIVSSVLLACVFAFGMSLASGLPLTVSQESTTG